MQQNLNGKLQFRRGVLLVPQWQCQLNWPESRKMYIDALKDDLVDSVMGIYLKNFLEI